MRSHTVSAEGGRPPWPATTTTSTYAKDTVKGSDFLADQDVDDFVATEPTRLEMGSRGAATPTVSRSAFGGMTTKRTGTPPTRSAFTCRIRCVGIRCASIAPCATTIRDEVLERDGACKGVAALEIRTGDAVSSVAF